ncbi:MAG: hypothetical protein WC197_09960 [Candidatus Gastranaerophilaceae bacterium]|jgi:hypothetical protein
MFETPVLFLIFNRPDETQRVFNRIREIKPGYLYVSADGPRLDKENEEEKCARTRAVIDQVDWDCEVKTLFREKNLGCKDAVSSGITWFFDNVEQGIIIEDDCLVSLSFFKYCEELLEKYKYDKRIMHISAENPLNSSFGEASYYFSKIPHIWGWATWKRAWDLYDVEFKEFDDFIKNNMIKNVFELKEAQKYWNKIFTRVKEGKINTWDYQWTYTLFINNGISINPNYNMVSNIGFDCEDAAHTTGNASCANREAMEIENIIHPEFILPDKNAVDQILQVRYDIYKKTPLFIIKREFSRMLKKLK